MVENTMSSIMDCQSNIMIKFGTALFCCLFLVNPIGVLASEDTPDVPEVWTARNSVEFSLLHSPDSHVALQRMNMATAAVDLARVGYYPSVDISAQYGQTNNPMYSFGNILNQGTFTPAIDFNNPGRTDDLNLRAGVEYRFYNGGRDQAGVEAAESGVSQSRMERESIHSRLAFEVLKSFQSMVQAEEMLQARNASIEAIRASLAVARARYEAGDLLKAD
jgi:outer membrane protein TolC